tara:strand:- start:6967 stop:7317 length:351 start_codon:yes stop_codon:yes gene_type:complete
MKKNKIMVIKWINRKLSGFITNDKNKEWVDLKNIHFPFYLSENEEEDTVTIIIPKLQFVAISKFLRYGQECFKHKSLPQWEPKLSTARSVDKVIDALCHDAHRIGSAHYFNKKTKK